MGMKKVMTRRVLITEWTTRREVWRSLSEFRGTTYPKYVTEHKEWESFNSVIMKAHICMNDELICIKNDTIMTSVILISNSYICV